MQVGIDVTCMYTNFGGCGLFGFRNTVTLKNGQISLSTHGPIGPWSMGRKGNLAVFESSSIFETGKFTPTKIVVYACDINLYLHEFFGPIPID